jgi:ATP-dependent RNA helicase RhlE
LIPFFNLAKKSKIYKKSLWTDHSEESGRLYKEISMSFNTLGLRTELLHAVKANGYTEPTPIQKKAIPAIIEGKDIMGGSQTGTGKTAAFILPILQYLYENGEMIREPRALVLTPTRELAAQIHQSIKTYGKFLPLESTVVVGGMPIYSQIKKLRQGVDILVATPGRLMDHVGQKTVDLSFIEVLVLDEADRMLDMGFINDIRRILRLLPPARQNLLFSATCSREITRLADGLLSDPEFIEEAGNNTAADTVTQMVYPVDRNRKQALLAHLIKEENWEKALVFTRTKYGANRLCSQLKRKGISATAIHSNKTQAARTRALSRLKRGDVKILVATDIAARGLDIPKMPDVVNFDLPQVPEDYVHRIGRTGRAGLKGVARSLVSPEEKILLADIQMILNYEIDVVEIEGFTPQEPAPVPKKRLEKKYQPVKKSNRSFGRGPVKVDLRRRQRRM